MACFLMGAVANLPLAVAPGMGINAYFTYTVVGFLGTGKITYQEALAAVFIEGWIFLIISISGVRGKIISAVPKCIMLATAGGIGLFLAFIGLQKSEGIGLVTYDPATLVTLGGCPRANRVYQYSVANATVDAVCPMDPKTNELTLNLGPMSPNYKCVGKRLHSANTWMGIAGVAVMAILMAKKVKGAIMMGIAFVTFISWIPGHGGSYLGAGSEIDGGAERLDYFKNVVSVPDASKTTLAWSWAAFGKSELWVALITFLYLDFLDATGTLFSMASMLNHRIPGFIDERTKAFPRQVFAFSVDGIAIILGSLFGCAPLTVYIESASGIREGGRTGITAIVVAFGFFISLFFTPLIVSIPPYATGPALILVGAMMMENIIDIDWANVREAIPAFITIIVMPLTYSIAYGVIAGICSYLFLYLALLLIDLLLIPFTKRPVRDVLDEHRPDLFAPSVTKEPEPFQSPSVVLQEHVRPEHAALAEANRAKDYGDVLVGDIIVKDDSSNRV